MEEIGNPQLSLRDFVPSGTFVDRDLRLPKREERERCHQAMLTCVQTLHTPNNFEAFKESAIKVFRSFGLTVSTPGDFEEWHEMSMLKAYDLFWQCMGDPAQAISIVDVEILDDERGYANFYIQHAGYGNLGLSDNEKTVMVVPGGCSQTVGKTKEYAPIKDFAKIFLETFPSNHNWLLGTPGQSGDG